MDSSRHRIDPEADERAASETDALDELRRLLVGSERAQLGKLQDRLDDPVLRTEDVSRVLPGAILVRSRQDGELASALSSTISESIKTSIRKDPQPLVDALFPVIGPAIRKAISDALMRMIQSLNQTIEYSLSARSWRWRLEAWRTGKPFAEVVLLHTLIYRVEQIFLIHRNTGLMLQHVKAESTISQDADMVSGMLTAIQDFVKDSFGSQADETLDEVHVGERTIWIVQGPQAVVAGVIWGVPHLDLKANMRQACEQIHRDHGAALAAFAGDTTPFELCRPCLEECLIAARHEPAKTQSGSKWPYAGLAVAVAIIAAVLSYRVVISMRERSAFDDYVKQLAAEPGIVIISAGKDGGQYTISGLRDPLAGDPIDLLRNYPRLATVQVVAHWEPYQSLSPQFVLLRVQRVLDPPATVKLTLSEGVLHARGTASAAWIAAALRIAPALPGIAAVDRAGLTPIDETAAVLEKAKAVLVPPDTVQLAYGDGVLRATGSAPAGWAQNARRTAILIPGVTRWQDDITDIQPRTGTALDELTYRQADLERRVVHFKDFFDADPIPGQEQSLDAVADDIKVLLRLSTAQSPLRVNIVGHTDSLGIDTTRTRVSLQRAENVLALLVLRGVPSESLIPVGVADREPVLDGADGRSNRNVTFRIGSLTDHP